MPSSAPQDRSPDPLWGALGPIPIGRIPTQPGELRARGEEIDLKQHNPEWRARRWVVEACHSWLNRNRGILIRWSKKEENHLAPLQLASGLIAFKRAQAARVAGVAGTQ